MIQIRFAIEHILLRYKLLHFVNNTFLINLNLGKQFSGSLVFGNQIKATRATISDRLNPIMQLFCNKSRRASLSWRLLSVPF
jgi:hypothetical protein